MVKVEEWGGGGGGGGGGHVLQPLKKITKGIMYNATFTRAAIVKLMSSFNVKRLKLNKKCEGIFLQIPLLKDTSINRQLVLLV